jgi:RNA-binding protein
MKKKQKDKKLTGKQKRYLRSLGHHLKPLVMLGREGITDNVINAAHAVLGAHELLKVKIGNGFPLEKGEAAAAIAERTGSEVIQILGKTFLVFRANPDRNDEQRIKLPE